MLDWPDIKKSRVGPRGFGPYQGRGLDRHCYCTLHRIRISLCGCSVLFLRSGRRITNKKDSGWFRNENCAPYGGYWLLISGSIRNKDHRWWSRELMAYDHGKNAFIRGPGQEYSALFRMDMDAMHGCFSGLCLSWFVLIIYSWVHAYLPVIRTRWLTIRRFCSVWVQYVNVSG